mmetsp:Transcript_11988/g.17482  ORF Transcript_11988/g.17482 Transcript_11988/m.17482 type:complete len:148 (+) Transcript_11988:69-512(+)
MRNISPLLLVTIGIASAYTSQPAKLSRKAFLKRAFTCTITTGAATHPIVQSIDDSSRSYDCAESLGYSGCTPSSKDELKKSYKNSIFADVKDLHALGTTIEGNQMNGNAWNDFFVESQRRRPDAVGRTYAALEDLVGMKGLRGRGTL